MKINRRTFGFLVALAVTTSCASWSSLHSETSIDAGQSFLLGGEQRGPFSAAVKNTGAVPVALFVESDGARRPVIVLVPNASIEAEFQPREVAVFSNTSNRRAVIKVDIRGGDSRNLGMRYDAESLPHPGDASPASKPRP
jgi:hypothetical protein